MQAKTFYIHVSLQIQYTNGTRTGNLEMTDFEDALRRRRERGRRSQANFRKRQAQVTQQATDQNRRLIDAVEKLVDATHGDESPELLERIFDAAEAAGIEAKRPMRYDTTERSSGPVDAGRQMGADHLDDEEDLTFDATTGHIVPKFRDRTNLGSKSLAPSLAVPPRLTCGIWLDPLRYTRISIPPGDIVPYLGPGSETFAGRIFWSIMDHTMIGCKHTHPEPLKSTQRWLHHSKATQDIKPSFIEAMVKARLEYRQTGSISPEYAAAGEADLGLVVRDQIEKEYYSRGEDPSLWLSSEAVEKRVRSTVGNVTFRLLEMAARDEGEPALRDLLNGVKCTLYDTFVCFGDGPRWNVSVVDGLFHEWLSKAIMSTL
ncbi:hypothetical protein F5B20DRAFT_312782 [Whalleya microplaca]|nr:hypothetical protein F5B20DRAFT_312782 [Whalleya microplaca]